MDLAVAVRVVREREGAVLTAGEIVVLNAFLALEPAAQRLYARLHARRGALHRDRDARAPLDAALCAAGLADPGALASLAERREAADVPALKAALRALGRPVSGARAALEARLGAGADARAALGAEGLRLRHRGLFQRVAALYLLDGVGDLGVLVAARRGHLALPGHAPVAAPRMLPHRAALHAWERARAPAPAEPSPAARAATAARALAAAPALGPLARKVDARRPWAARLAEAAEALARAGDRPAAAAALRAIADAGLDTDGSHRLRAWQLEPGPAPAAALRAAAALLPALPPPAARALDRSARALARRSGLGWAPLPALEAAPVRVVPVPRAAPGAAPRAAWADGRGIEAAVLAHLAAAGRRAAHVEGAWASTAFALLFRDALLAPIPGVLPSPLSAAPLDLGTPDFVGRRRALIDDRRAAIRAGEAAALAAAAAAAGPGEARRGLDWSLVASGLLGEVLRAMPGPALDAVLAPFLVHGFRAAAGWPDLVILPGPPCVLPGALPATLGPGLLWAEIKGPTDTLREAQALWHHALRAEGQAVERWEVVPAAPRVSAAPHPRDP